MLDQSAKKRPVLFIHVLFGLVVLLVSALIFWFLSMKTRNDGHVSFSKGELLGTLIFSGSALALMYRALFGGKVRFLFIILTFIIGVVTPFTFCYWIEWRSQITKYDIVLFQVIYLFGPFFVFLLFPDRHTSKKDSNVMHGAKIE